MRFIGLSYIFTEIAQAFLQVGIAPGGRWRFGRCHSLQKADRLVVLPLVLAIHLHEAASRVVIEALVGALAGDGFGSGGHGSGRDVLARVAFRAAQTKALIRQQLGVVEEAAFQRRRSGGGRGGGW